ncbi:DUF2332 domain-containing protein [Marinactinospora rubrisoli]|uniref:DUF2332 domain-containing protein n=1 Tax=Marinactinospora rubrisoli TaxID=2715399 RepID=A0ABW2KIH3_9ACTN
MRSRPSGTADAYRRFAELEAHGNSPTYEALSNGVAADPELLELLDLLPPGKRQPNLLLAAVRHLGGPTASYREFRAWVLAHWERVRAVMLARLTQTNESARCAVLLPLLAALPQPLALIEVGASAGLCLYPDRYRYAYDGAEAFGHPDSPITLPCRTSGPVPPPCPLPTVTWRAGIDLNPLSASDPEDVRWLESLVWPEQRERLTRLRGALSVARGEPALLLRGDLNATVRRLVAQAPAGATPVVFHSAVLAYLPGAARQEFVRTVRELPCHWISNEAPGVLPGLKERLPVPVPAGRGVFLLALDGRPVAFTSPHGQRLDWFAREPGPGSTAAPGPSHPMPVT